VNERREPPPTHFDEAAVRRVLELLPDAVVVIDDSFRVRWANPAAEELFGKSLEDWVGRSAVEFIHPADVTLAASSTLTVQTKRVGTPIEVRVATPGGWRLVEIVGRSALDDPVAPGLVLVLRDLTDRRRWEIAHDDSARFRAVVGHSPAMTWLIDEDGRVVAASAAVTRRLGRDPEFLEGSPFDEVIHPEDRPLAAEAFALAERDGVESVMRPATVRVRVVDAAGEVAMTAEMAVVSLQGEVVDGFVVSIQDVSGLVEAERVLKSMARSDQLTGLPNRIALIERLQAELAGTVASDQPLSVLFLDLDGFKAVNDDLGHILGDQVLSAVAGRFRSALRSSDYLARYGGDEFVVVARVDEAGADGLARRLRDALSDEVSTAVGVARVGVSIGIAHARPDDSPATLLAAADTRMYAAKNAHYRPTD
jgi:diguanylate cyclase (GGDEF)-like protein/PAS domain S-box-containing protein